MTFREKLKQEHPENINACHYGGCKACPSDYQYEVYDDAPCRRLPAISNKICTECWDREIPETEKKEEKGRYDDLGFDLKCALDGLMKNGFGRTEALELINSIIIGNGYNYRPPAKSSRPDISVLRRNLK